MLNRSERYVNTFELPTMLFHEKLFEKTSSEVTFDDFVKDKKEFLKKEMYQDPNVQEVAKEYIESLKILNYYTWLAVLI